ncbi:hypothetical protein [Dermatobacter hominis]|uniref:hypothetical protein n=1 Tax=Dermatobacter hominis TaxID=2884263 RepID=UPI001D12594D|nr:hypothetical protein [Dermatobacter hominis]UDY37334.1 hypothetical protein LH044_07295 [Dermatobacter hominis]
MSSSTDPPAPAAGDDEGAAAGADPADPGSGRRTASWLRWVGVALVALVGAGIGATLLGQTSVDTAVGEVELTSRPAIGGGFTMSLAPLGTIDLPSASPLHLQARLVALDDALLVKAGRDVAKGQGPISQAEAERVADEAASRISDAAVPLAMRTVLGGLVGGALAALLVYRSRREVAVGAAVGLVAVGALTVAAFVTLPDTVDDAQVNGALGLLPQASPGLLKDAEGVEEYISKTFRNIEGLYTGYVRSAAADRIARTSDRVIAVTGDPADDEVRRQVAVLASSQGAEGVLWIVSDDADAADGRPAFPELPTDVASLFVLPDDPAGIRFLDRFPVVVLGADGSMPTGPAADAVKDSVLAVEAGGGAVPADVRVAAISTGDEPSATGARLTDDSGAVRVTTGTAVEGRLEGVVLSFGRNAPEVLQAQLVTVADGDISMTRVLR